MDQTSVNDYISIKNLKKEKSGTQKFLHEFLSKLCYVGLVDFIECNFKASDAKR